MTGILVIDALARFRGRRYSTFDVVGAGPRVVAGVLESLGYNVLLLSYEKLLENKQSVRNYPIVLISIMSQDIGALRRIRELIKRHNSQAKIIVGGPGSYDYKTILEKGLADLVIIGEGEIPLQKLFGEKGPETINEPEELAKIPALAYKYRGYIRVTSLGIHTPKDILDKLRPWTKIWLSYDRPWFLRIYVETIRGCSNYMRPRLSILGCVHCNICVKGPLNARLKCPANIPPGCGFCSVPALFGPPRSRSIESIVSEVEELIANGAERIVLSAPDFLDYMREELVYPQPLTDPCNPPPNYDAIEKLLSRLHEIEEIRHGKVKIFIENIKACLVDAKVARIFGRYLKGTPIHIGLETGDKEYNELIGKPADPVRVVLACRILRSHGLRPYVYLMYGLPYQGVKTYRKTLAIIKKLEDAGVEKITLYKYTPLPRTAFQNLKPQIEKYRDIIAVIKRRIQRFNYSRKKDLLNKFVEAYLILNKENMKWYGYPVMHGPTIFIRDRLEESMNGARALVKIVGISSRYVWGKVIRIIARYR